MKIGIAIDDWKLEIFERHLAASGYDCSERGRLPSGALLLTVDTENAHALEMVVLAANTEAARTGAPTKEGKR